MEELNKTYSMMLLQGDQQLSMCDELLIDEDFQTFQVDFSVLSEIPDENNSLKIQKLRRESMQVSQLNGRNNQQNEQSSWKGSGQQQRPEKAESKFTYYVSSLINSVRDMQNNDRSNFLFREHFILSYQAIKYAHLQQLDQKEINQKLFFAKPKNK